MFSGRMSRGVWFGSVILWCPVSILAAVHCCLDKDVYA
jgi:hypothetical protein